MFVYVHHAEVGRQGGERIVGDFRTGVAELGQQSGFTGVRQAYQTYIGDHLKLQVKFYLFAFFALFGELRRLAAR